MGDKSQPHVRRGGQDIISNVNCNEINLNKKLSIKSATTTIVVQHNHSYTTIQTSQTLLTREPPITTSIAVHPTPHSTTMCHQHMSRSPMVILEHPLAMPKCHSHNSYQALMIATSWTLSPTTFLAWDSFVMLVTRSPSPRPKSVFDRTGRLLY
jgi:hypothetical protein